MPKNKSIEEIISEAESGEIDLSLFDVQDDRQLKEMNKKHAFINSVDGKPMIMCNIYSPVYDRDVIEFRSPDAIKIQYSNESVELVRGDKIRYIELGTWWIKNKDRREYDTIIFDPSKPREYNKCLNLWEGFTVEPIKGSWIKTRKHIWKILCNKDPVKFKYVIKWFAWCVQNPHERAEVCMIFKGKQGAGKGFILTQFVELFGVHGMQIAQRDHLTGQFGGHLRKIVFLYADEAYYPGDKEVEGNLKNLITESKVTREAKHVNPVLDKNRLHIVMSTNNEWVIPATQDSRRFFINKVDDVFAKNNASNAERKRYFDPLWKEMNEGGRGAMLYDLLNYDLQKWHPRDDIPDTEELLKQQYMSLTKAQKCILEFLEHGYFPGAYTSNRQYLVESGVFAEYLNELDSDNNKVSNKAKITAIKELGVETTSNGKRRQLLFPTLQEMREKWDAKYPHGDWNREESWKFGKQEY